MTNREKEVTIALIKEYDEQQPDLKERYSYIKKNKKALSHFVPPKLPQQQISNGRTSGKGLNPEESTAMT